MLHNKYVCVGFPQLLGPAFSIPAFLTVPRFPVSHFQWPDEMLIGRLKMQGWRIFCAIECVTTVQGHPRSLILAPIERAYSIFYQSLIVTLVLRYSDLLAENCEFFQRHSHLTPSLAVNPVEYIDEQLSIAKIKVLGLSVGEDFVILACVVLTQCQRVTDRQTNGQTDNSTAVNTGLCIASDANAL